MKQFKEVYYVNTLTIDNIIEEKRKLHRILQCLIIESKILYRQYKNTVIKQFTQQ